MKQKTINKEISFEGVGVHLGLPSRIVLKPASVDSGIVFTNVRFSNQSMRVGTIIPEAAMHASVIKNEIWMVSTVEHLMAAISAFEIDNVEIEVSGLEIPILDGSALFFVNRIKEVGLHEQSAKKTFLTPKKTLVFEDKDHDRILKIVPARDTVLTFDYVADFEHPLLSKGELQGTMSLDFFITHIAAARTFGFLEQLPFLRRHGLAKGTTLGNTVVIGEEEFLNDKRFEDEFVRHKFLDLVGDLALLGKNLAGSIIAQKTGHNFNRLVVKHYVENPEEWTIVSE